MKRRIISLLLVCCMVLSLALEDKTAARRGEGPAAPFFPPKNGRAENHRKDPARAGGRGPDRCAVREAGISAREAGAFRKGPDRFPGSFSPRGRTGRG